VRHPAALPEEKVRPQLRQLLATHPLGGQCGSDASRYGNGVPVANPYSARTGSNGAAFLWAALCYFFA
jgi:hypothetical protein